LIFFFGPTGSNNKKRGVLGEIEGGRKVTRPARGVKLKRKVRKGAVKIKRSSRDYILFRYGVDQNVPSLTCGSWSRLTVLD